MRWPRVLSAVGLDAPQATVGAAADDFALGRVWYGFTTARVTLSAVLLLLQLFLFSMGANTSLLLVALCASYLLATVWVRLAGRPSGPQQNFDAQWLPIIGVDLAAYGVLQHLQLGNITYTPLYALPVLMAAVLGSSLLALGTAAAVTLLLLADAWWMVAGSGVDLAPRLLQAGLTGVGMFAVALLANGLAARLVREEQQARRSQLAARTQIQVNELVVEALGDGVLVVDGNGIVRAVNPAARRLLGSAATVRATPFVLAAEPGWQALCVLARQTSLAGTAQWTDAVLSEGSQHAQRVHARTRLTGASNAGESADPLCVVFMQDLRETEARIRSEKVVAMGRMSAAVAHEIRNPLAAITQANALLLEDLSAPEHRQLATMVAQNAKRLARIVDEVLDLARVQEISPGSTQTLLDLAAALPALCGEWSAQHAVGQRLQVQPSARAVVVFEEDHLRRVLVNLLDNALRYASHQARAMVVCVDSHSHGGAQLTVWSDGAPIDAGVQAHLFEPFFSSESRSSGLGLYICRQLCERYGASMTYLRSAMGERMGNAFVVVFGVPDEHPLRSDFSPLMQAPHSADL